MIYILDLDNLNDEKIDIEEQISSLESDIETLQEEIEELESELLSIEDDDEEGAENQRAAVRLAIQAAQDEIEEKKSEIIELQDSLKPYEELESELGMDLRHASRELTLIEEDSFEDYCQELCEDIGDISKDLPWYIKDAIDWEQVADSLRADYSEVEWDGGTYLWRE